MGNYKFRFSDMIPNAWFHKLKDMSKPKSTLNPTKKKLSSSPPPSAAAQIPTPHLSDQRKSYYFTRDQPDSHKRNLAAQSPRKSSSRRRRRRRSVERKPPRLVSSSAACKCRATFDDSPPSPEESTNSGPDQSSSSDPDSVLTEYGSDRDQSWTAPCKCRPSSNIVIDINNHDHRRLPPIITKPTAEVHHRQTSTEFSERNSYTSLSLKVVKEDFLTGAGPEPGPVRRLPPKAKISTSSPSAGVKLRLNSPRMRIQGRRSVSSSSSSSSRRSISDSFAVVKASRNPGRDFKESMVEMIVENNIRGSKDLEELLACYLSLNSDEYHDLIINVFKQIWFDFIHLRLK